MIHVMLLARGGRKREQRSKVQKNLAEATRDRKSDLEHLKGMS